MYTGVCASLASCGYVVIAVEHTDGSACFARDAAGTQIPYTRYKANAADISMYKRFGPNSAYSKQRLVSYRAPFLATRAAELRAAIEQALVDGGAGPPSLHAERVLASADRTHVHLLGHSFGAASVLLVGQQLEQLERDLQQACEDSASSAGVEPAPIPAPPRIATVSLLDPWLSSAGEAAVARGLRTPLLAMLSRGWCDGNEFNLTRALSPAASYCLPLAQHTSFSDAPNWFPGLLTKRFGLRGKKEPLHATHADVALAVAAHMSGSRDDEVWPSSMSIGERKPKRRWSLRSRRIPRRAVEPLPM